MFLVDSFKVVPYSIYIGTFFFISEYTVYSIMLLLFFAVDNCHVILMLLTDCNVFLIELAFLYGLYTLCNTYEKKKLQGELPAHYAICVHTAKLYNLTRRLTDNSSVHPNYRKTCRSQLVLMVFKHDILGNRFLGTTFYGGNTPY